MHINRNMFHKSSFLCVLLIMTLFTSACFNQELTLNDYINHAHLVSGAEELTNSGLSEDNRCTFTCAKREVTFDVWTTADEVVMDGRVVGYSGDYSFHDNYSERVHAFYNERISDLMQQYGLVELKRSEDFDALVNIIFVIDSDNAVVEEEEINGFLKELQALTDEEQSYHSSDFAIFLYRVGVWRKEADSYYKANVSKDEDSLEILAGERALTVNRFNADLSEVSLEVNISDSNTVVLGCAE